MKKTKSKLKNSAPLTKHKVTFDVSESDRELFLDFLENETIPKKDEAEHGLAPRKAKLNQRNLPLSHMTIDLHGYSIQEAKLKIEIEISALAIRGCSEVVIITGRGKHSSGQTHTLAKEIPAFIRKKFGNFVIFLSDIAFDPELSDLPLKGFFRIKVLPQSGR